MAAVEGDEVGDVAESRDGHVVIERLIGEIRAMTPRSARTGWTTARMSGPSGGSGLSCWLA
jgi:hypothetical protein